VTWLFAQLVTRNGDLVTWWPNDLIIYLHGDNDILCLGDLVNWLHVPD